MKRIPNIPHSESSSLRERFRRQGLVSKEPAVTRRKQEGGFSLIEMIGVMGIITILALALAPIFIKQMDQIAADKESAQLRTFADAFRQAVRITKTIPNQNGWDSMIATNLGLQVGQVRTNARWTTRLFLIDPDMQIGVTSGKLPYIQTTSGSQVQDGLGYYIPPVNPRLMIVSSISQPLPATLTNGVTASTGAYCFSNIWNTTDGTIPSGWTWTGKGTDLKVQRIQLTDLFFPLILNNTGTSVGKYSINGVGPLSVPNPSLISYFIDTTLLELMDCATNRQYGEILHQSKSFDFILCSWRSEKFLGRTIQHPDAVDLQTAANAFLASSNNPTAKFSTTTQKVYNDMLGYLSNYVQWAESSPAYGNAGLKKNLTDGGTAMNTDAGNLITP